ncbi:3-oxoadipate enol-lactonase 1 [Hartmannibacter diazotrophicus]|uniref:3-oxoadipate enol-lactonase 1 n=1 Tax=Hartmannibacter diazotrophicus TaxID=1482074 RepID=A0A2C9D0R6_9HYPH|nr:3-oxoadipate enol-lactonase [Hartmannibacter diazotrophicus]SON53836.1 3-oxoadipate enol-lactonase 1 [Hartmannibacter diazotrophicus]
MPFASVNDLILHHRIDGPQDGPVVVLANSLGCDLRIWDEVAGVLSGRYRVVCYDKRGHGLSSQKAGPSTIADHADDLIGLVDHLGIGNFAIVGLSVGGLIAQDIAGRFGGRLQAMVLCDTAAKIGTAEAWNARIGAIETGGLLSIADTVVARWFGEDFRTRRPVDVAGWTTMLARMPADGYVDACRAIRDADYRASAAAIVVPTLCIAGSEDLSTPPDLVRETASLIPGARFEIIDGAGHLPPLEVPAELSARIGAFLEECGLG